MNRRQSGGNHCHRTKKKEWKERRTVKETSGTTSSTPTFTLYGFQKKKGPEKIFEEIIAKNLPDMEKDTIGKNTMLCGEPEVIGKNRSVSRGQWFLKQNIIKDTLPRSLAVLSNRVFSLLQLETFTPERPFHLQIFTSPILAKFIL